MTYEPKRGEIIRLTITSPPSGALVSAVRVYEGEFKYMDAIGIGIDDISASVKATDDFVIEPLGYREGTVALVTVTSTAPLAEGDDPPPPLSALCAWLNGAWRAHYPQDSRGWFGQPPLGEEPIPDLDVQVDVIGMLP